LLLVAVVGPARSLTITMSSSPPKAPRRVIVAGAGVVGTSTAYYLAKEFQVPVTLIDPTGQIAPAASGKAGGFLALDWNDYSNVGPLTRRSFHLHQVIADQVGADRIQYRRLTCASIQVAEDQEQGRRPTGKKLQGIEWAEGSNALGGARSLGTEETIAQVHPKKLCQVLFEETQRLAPGSELVQGRVVSPIHNNNNNKDGHLIGVSIVTTKESDIGGSSKDTTTTTVIQGDALVYACGPWTANNMFGTKYHSLVVPTRKKLTQCVFFSGCGDPEVYVRPDNTAYLTGFPDPATRVTEEPGKEEVRSDAIETIRQSVISASSGTDDMVLSATDGGSGGEIQQACYLPSTSDGTPMMGALHGQPGCYVATGHTCWGILMGPATGEAMAHLVMTGRSPHVDLSPFNPSRFGQLQMVPQ
jgi:glycine/D-amino acid oxidase-like deaminating enzyme